MEIQINSVGAPSQSAVRQPGAAGATADFENFLRLLTAQLRNQDPLSPLDSTQFVAQLASFSTVEQLVSANARLADISAQFSGRRLVEYSGWIGRVAEVNGLPAQFNGAPIRIGVATAAGAATASLVVRDSSGAEIDRVPVPPTGGAFEWSSPAARIAERYSFEVELTFADDSRATFQAATFARINGVRQTAGGVILDLEGGVSLRPDQMIGLSG